MKFARIYTNKGVLTAKLYEDETPKTIEHFSRLVDEEFYNGVTFHKYIKGALIQTGSPTGKDNGWGHFFVKGEPDAKLQRHDIGVLSMATTPHGYMSTQFFICLSEERTTQLDGFHTCFGILSRSDYNILMTLRKGDVIEKIEIMDAMDTEDMSSMRSFSNNF